MKAHWKSWPALTVPSAVLISPSSVNRFPNKVAPKLPNNISSNLSFYSFASLLIVWLKRFINKPDS